VASTETATTATASQRAQRVTGALACGSGIAREFYTSAAPERQLRPRDRAPGILLGSWPLFMRVATSPSAAEPLRVVEVPSRRLRAGELRVRVRSIGVNPVDWKMREGGPLRLAQRLLGPSGPLVVGVDFAGEVLERGAPPQDLAVGARVVGGTNFSRRQLGSYADEVVVRSDQCALLPDAVSFDDAAGLPVAAVTAWRGLHAIGALGTRPDARALVLGASGGVGLFAVQIARMLRAKVLGVCSARTAPTVARFGAEILEYTAGDVMTRARAAGPFDVILNSVGTGTYPASACRAMLRPGGVLGLVVVQPQDWLALMFSRPTRLVFGRPTRTQLEPLVAALARGDLTTVIEATFPLEEAEAAHALSRAGKVVGKILLHP
jgi:NADPH2:quinone reductase